MKNIIYRPSWQKLRVSFLSSNHPNGGFTTETGTQDNLERLTNYINDATTGAQYTVEENTRMGFTMEEEYACRIYRAINLLNATWMGFGGTGTRHTPAGSLVNNYRQGITDLYNGSLAVKADRKWDWDVVQFELEELWRKDIFWFQRVYNDLNRRGKVGARRRREATGDASDVENTRPQLIKFLQIMDTINHRPTV